MQFLPGSGHVDTAVWMHHVDANETAAEKIDGNYTKTLRVILNKSWRQHPTRHQLYGHLPPITKTIQVRRTGHAGLCWRSRNELISDVLLWTSTYGRAKAGRPARTYSSYVRIRDVALNTFQRRWAIGKSGKRGSGISVLAARHEDDDDYVYIRTNTLRKGMTSLIPQLLVKKYQNSSSTRMVLVLNYPQRLICH